MDNFSKKEKSPEILRLRENLQEITKPGNLRLKYGSNSNQKVWVLRRPDKRGKDEVVAIDLELQFRNSEGNR